MPTIGQKFADRNKLQHGVNINNILLCVKDERRLHEVTYETTCTRNDDNQDSRSALGQSRGHTSLS
jgi:hypothetical protein